MHPSHCIESGKKPHKEVTHNSNKGLLGIPMEILTFLLASLSLSLGHLWSVEFFLNIIIFLQFITLQYIRIQERREQEWRRAQYSKD